MSPPTHLRSRACCPPSAILTHSKIVATSACRRPRTPAPHCQPLPAAKRKKAGLSVSHSRRLASLEAFPIGSPLHRDAVLHHRHALNDACDADVALRGVANMGNSEQMGSFDGIWGLQPCCPSLLRHMLFLVPGALVAADQVCHSVCCKETWGVPLSPSPFFLCPPSHLFPLLPCDTAA
jgi:hypothetical protein